MGPRRKDMVGKNGEAYAQEYLRARHYRIIATNYRTRRGEIDIIAFDRDCLCFIEVKTRSGDGFGDPEEAVTPAKQRTMSRVVMEYLHRHRVDAEEYRFDVISVISDGDAACRTVRHFPNAFALDARFFM